jgi:O-antigen/teichoic acid export membrane protein
MLKNRFVALLSQKLKTDLFTNSLWGILSNILQNILFSVFFIVVARKYNTTDFASYILANTLYGFVVAFSSLGLGQWFIRELVNIKDKDVLVGKFFKIQFYVGILFYVVVIVLSLALYHDALIRQLSLLIGINIIFDNVIYVVKFVNIAQLEQKKTFIILTVEALLKFLVACFLFVAKIPIVYLALILILLRFTTLNLFLRIGTSNLINFSKIIKATIDKAEVKNIIISNWPFIIIGSVSVIYWSIGNIIVSKFLTLNDVANYEISFKLFSMAEILPVIVSATIFPKLVKLYKEDEKAAYNLYKMAFVAYAAYGIMMYTFMYSYLDLIIPNLFGAKYIITPVYCKQMFLTILIFPTVLLQANLLIAMKLEKIDMWLNVLSLVISLSVCFIGLHYLKSLSVVNYAIFFSFCIFHIVQDMVLAKRKITSNSHIFIFYLLTALVVVFYRLVAIVVDPYYWFIIFWSVLSLLMAIIFFRVYYKKNAVLTFGS